MSPFYVKAASYVIEQIIQSHVFSGLNPPSERPAKIYASTLSTA
jgi:hypothetical protein